MTTLGWKRISVFLLLCAMTAIASPAQTFTTLANFDGTNGRYPYAGLMQATDGNFYGTTSHGGDDDIGAVFKITTTGALVRLHSFDGSDGKNPEVLIQATDGTFYGATTGGGAEADGTVFKITARGRLTRLHSFAFTDGDNPHAGLVYATDGNFYGTTGHGGNQDCSIGCGTVFKITPEGVLTTLHNFDGTDGDSPYGLLQAVDGNFYGTTGGGGTHGFGTIFELTPAGKMIMLHNFDGADGSHPAAGLNQGTDGNFYGTTNYAGGHGGGTVFRITPAGTLTTLYSFCAQTNCADGSQPLAGLVQATDGNFYGTTSAGGANGDGTVFEITPTGALTTLHSFDSGDGSGPTGWLIQATNGTFYGTANYGGANGDGTVFSLSVGLGPFVSFGQDSGKVGWKAEILGQGFTGTTAVSFNGTPAAAFVVKSDTYLRATVPAGATTGPVTVTMPSVTLTSNVPFRVRPQLLSFNPTSGAVGAQVTITGVSLTQTTGVGFGGVPATSFTVNSDTQVTATVPTGALSGHIGITTAGGRTWSTADFTVTQ